jgi:hypothetical protein
MGRLIAAVRDFSPTGPFCGPGLLWGHVECHRHRARALHVTVVPDADGEDGDVLYSVALRSAALGGAAGVAGSEL